MQNITIVITPEAMQDPAVRELVKAQTERENHEAFLAKFEFERGIELRAKVHEARAELKAIKVIYQKQQLVVQAKPPLPEAESGL